MTSPRPKLRVVGPKCPSNMRASVLREMETRLAAIGSELSKFADAAQYDIDDEDLFGVLAVAAADVQLARLAIARRSP